MAFAPTLGLAPALAVSLLAVTGPADEPGLYLLATLLVLLQLANLSRTLFFPERPVGRGPVTETQLGEVGGRLERLEQYVHDRAHKADSDLQAVSLRVETCRVQLQELLNRSADRGR